MERDSGAARRSRSGGAARCPVRQQPVSDRNSPTKPDFYDRSVASRSRRRARRPRGRLVGVRSTARDGAAPAAVATALRRLKRQVALAVAVADIAGAWPLEQVTGSAERFASGCLDALTDSILLQLARDGQLGIGSRSRGRRPHRAGHGQARRRRAQLLERYRPDPALRPRGRRPLPATTSCRGTSCAAARMLVQLMSETSADGYIFRTDLRLRPDPGSTPLAMSVQAAELYYESVGQNWERAAMIKAHPVAGNRAVGEAFLAELRPISGASISTSRRSTTSIRSSARSTPIAAAARSRCWATTSSSAAAASARSSSSPRPSS